MKVFTDMIFDKTLGGLQKSMDLTWKRNEAISSNIANAETPGYRASDLDFAGELEKAFSKNTSPLTLSNSKHIDIGNAGNSHLVADLSGATKPDGNNVDIDIQMGQLDFNRSQYIRSADFMRRKMRLLATAIRSIS
ncbi:MAG: flagellar basal body rod protein FlgB [SAR324 cluster bacterium]|uniref:Flagellar basal body rod protein FlgB n=1 Tax=SAR324 cluster bacterium TaxID=2024889 RepID=A0A7X9ILD2_9DELT|nr:flagellar basal body rod protein FlgB [SAR324 cluster bacterium]